MRARARTRRIPSAGLARFSRSFYESADARCASRESNRITLYEVDDLITITLPVPFDRARERAREALTREQVRRGVIIQIAREWLRERSI
jgi:hypothetical protein